MKYFFGQKTIQKNLLFLGLFLLSLSTLHANSLDTLLQDYNQKNALSQKTIDENKGHLMLFSREKLEKMHAKTLKDVFKATPAIYYNENRYGLPDPLTTGAFEPYSSNFIRLYVDGVEITQGWMGSGIMLYGDINIDFVDHIEFYYITPSFETSIEPAYLTIFIYSKDPKRDSGGKLDLIQGSRGYNSQSISFGEEKEDFSYMVNFSHTNAKREKIDNGTAHPLSRDFERTQLFSTIKNEDQIFHLQILKKKTDSAAGLSFDATPLASKVDYLNIHMDYGIDLDEHWHAQFAYDWLRTDVNEEDNTFLIYLGESMPTNIFNGKLKNSTYTGELTYKNEIGDHRITAGIKGRVKELDSIDIKNIGKVPLSFSKESLLTVFFQDQYRLNEQQLLTLGIAYNNVSRNADEEDDTLLQLRLGYIYSNENWIYKAYLYRIMFSLDPLTRLMAPSYSLGLEPQVTLGVTQELSYANDEQRVRFVLSLMKDEDTFLQTNTGGLERDTEYYTMAFNYDYNFDIDNKVGLQLYYSHYKNVFDLDTFEDVGGYLELMNSYEEFDFYNSIIWHARSTDWKDYFDLTSSVTWNVNEDFMVTLKGENILGKARETSLHRIDPVTGNMLSPLKYSPIDKRIILEVEYHF